MQSTANLADFAEEDLTGDMGNGLIGSESEALAMKAEKMIEARSRRNYDLANRSR